jgi:LPS sulfotransferase NodH
MTEGLTTTLDLAASQERPRGYVICTTPRCGSYLLCEALEATHRLGTPREYFDASPGKEKSWVDKLQIETPRDYIEKVMAAGAAPNGVFGLKLHGYQIEDMNRRFALAAGCEPTPGVSNAFGWLRHRFEPLQFVWLRRRNKVAQAISLHRAFATGLWHQRPVADGAAAAERAKFDFEALERHCDWLDAQDRDWFEFFKADKSRVLAVDYEEFVRSPEQFQQTVVEVAKFLGVALNRIEVGGPTFRRQADDVSQEWEARYRRMKQSGRASAGAPSAPEAAGSTERTPLIAYDLNPLLGVRISAASPRRRWMDETHQRFAYRCLPLTIANQHGWLLHTPCAIRARWTGGAGKDAVQIEYAPGKARPVASSHFGGGVLTFAINYIFRTPPGVNLWVRGPANSPKDGLYPLDGVVETDWSEATFTMNWKFTRADHWVEFEVDEPFAMIAPVARGFLEQFDPEIRPIASDPALQAGHAAWSRSRLEFNRDLTEQQSAARAKGWQRHYMRGEAPSRTKAAEHQTSLAIREFSGDGGG